MIYDVNDPLSQRRKERSQGLQEQIGRLDEQIAALERHQSEARAAREALERLEAVLLRMSMLAREAARTPRRREGLAEEFEDCKRKIEALSDQAELYGFNLVKNRVELVRSVLNGLIDGL